MDDRSPAPGHRPWLLYVVRCGDGTLYTGITTDLDTRLRAHNAGRGARYTRGRRPVALLAAWPLDSESAARSAEARFKRLSRPAKLKAIAAHQEAAAPANGVEPSSICSPPRIGMGEARRRPTRSISPSPIALGVFPACPVVAGDGAGG